MDLRLKFNEDEANYDHWRPTYTPGLFEDIIAYANLDQPKRAMEIGLGTGQATLPILQTGCQLTAIEIGAKLADYAPGIQSCITKRELLPHRIILPC